MVTATIAAMFSGAALTAASAAAAAPATGHTQTWSTHRTDHFVPNLQMKAGQKESAQSAGTTLDSSNWSGYQLSVLGGGSTPGAPSSPYTSVSGSWTIPTATEETPGQAEDGADWIGIGGGFDAADSPAGDPLLIQTGVEEDVSAGGVASYSAWYEILPEPETAVSMPVNAGDIITASISSALTSPGMWTVTEKDDTTGNSFTESIDYPAAMDTAEWVEEAPTEVSASSPGEATLPNLGVTEFSGTEVNGAPAPLSQAFALDMEPSSSIIAVASAPDSTGADFNVCAYPDANLDCAAPSGPLAVPSGGGSTGGSGVAYATDGPSSTAACAPLFTASPGASTFPPEVDNSYPQLDVVQGDLHNTDSALYAVLTVADMEEGASAVPPPGTANEYYFTFDYMGNEYFLSAEVSALGDAYEYGTVSSTTGYSGSGSATGTIVDGTDGTITISAPLSDFSLPAGATLTAPGSQTAVLEGVPSNPAVSGGEEIYAYKVAGTSSYTLGEVCSTNGAPGSDGAAADPAGGSVPEAPLAAAIPVAGLVLAGALVVRRRRRGVTSTAV